MYVEWPHIELIDKYNPVVFICCGHYSRVVPVGEASVIAVISSIHRKEALEAVSFAIDSLKTSVPIWKKVRKCLGTVGVILFMTSVTVCTFPS